MKHHLFTLWVKQKDEVDSHTSDTTNLQTKQTRREVRRPKEETTTTREALAPTGTTAPPPKRAIPSKPTEPTQPSGTQQRKQKTSTSEQNPVEQRPNPPTVKQTKQRGVPWREPKTPTRPTLTTQIPSNVSTSTETNPGVKLFRDKYVKHQPQNQVLHNHVHNLLLPVL